MSNDFAGSDGASLTDAGRLGLCVMAKLPQPGLVNTRLQPRLGPEDSARLQELLMTDLLCRAFPDSHEKHLFISGGDSQTGPAAGSSDAPLRGAPLFRWLEPWPDLGRAASEHEWRLHVQRGLDLGSRMQHAARQVLSSCDRVIVLGTDAPGLPEALIRDAVRHAESHDAAIIPSSDGGYVGISMELSGLPLLSSEISWGTNEVVAETLTLADRLGLSVALCEAWFDLDTVADIESELVECSDARRNALCLTAPRAMDFVHQRFVK